MGLISNPLGDQGAKHIMDVFRRSNSTLEELSLSSCGITDIGADYIATGLADARASGSALRRIWIWGNKIAPVGERRIANSMAFDPPHIEVFVRKHDDAHPLCRAWSERGECSANINFMAEFCPASCRKVVHRIEEADDIPWQHYDAHPECPAWAMQNDDREHCYTPYMTDLCYASCEKRWDYGEDTHPHGHVVRGEATVLAGIGGEL